MSNFAQLQREFAAHLRNPFVNPAPDGIENRRLAIYRELFFRNLNNLLTHNFPVVRKIFGDDGWNRLVRHFFTHHESHAPLFPELPREFLRYLETRRDHIDDDPAFLLELAHYEWVELALGHDENDLDAAFARVDPDGSLLDQVPVVSPLAWRLSYAFPVHRLGPDYQPQTPPKSPTHLVVYRRRDDKVRFLELNPVAARLIELLQENNGHTGLHCLQQIAQELSSPVETVVDHGRQLLKQLHDREIITGTVKGDDQ